MSTTNWQHNRRYIEVETPLDFRRGRLVFYTDIEHGAIECYNDKCFTLLALYTCCAYLQRKFDVTSVKPQAP